MKSWSIRTSGLKAAVCFLLPMELPSRVRLNRFGLKECESRNKASVRLNSIKRAGVIASDKRVLLLLINLNVLLCVCCSINLDDDSYNIIKKV